jgi:phage tail sheath protein FI
MPNYRSPGVYVEEIDAGPKPIEGVSTSVAGMVGVTARGPVAGKPLLVTSFADFLRSFGGYLPPPPKSVQQAWDVDEGGEWWTFPLAVKGFFDNGGEQLYVKRVVASGAAASAKAAGMGLVADVTRPAAKDAKTVNLSHLFNVAVGTQLTIVRTEPLATAGPFAVTAYDATSGAVTLDAPTGIGLELKANRDQVVIHTVSTAAADTTVRFTASSPGAWGDGLKVKVRPVEAASLRLLPSDDPAVAGAAAQTTVKNAAAAGDTEVEVDAAAGFAANNRVVIKSVTYAIDSVSGAKLKLKTAVPAGGFAAGTPVRRLRPTWDWSAAGAKTTTLRVWGASALYKNAIVELDTGSGKETTTVDGVAGDLVTFAGDLTGHYFEGNSLRVIEAQVDVRYAPSGTVEAEESHPGLRLVDDGSPRYLLTWLNQRSQLIGADAPTPANFPLAAGVTDLSGFPSFEQAWQALGSGDDAYSSLTTDDFNGEDKGSGKRTGIAALEDIDEVSMALVPGVWAPGVHSTLITHCETMKDRFAILDVRRGLDIAKVRENRAAIDSKYAALYYPWLVVRDPSIALDVQLAPGAHMAGIYARVDTERGVHKAPANEVVRSIVGFADDVSKREQDLLNPEGINALRFFPGRGFRVWGARTLSSDASWKYINVRRLFLFIEESIQKGTQWVVFEPNDEPLWARVRATIKNFLRTQWRAGALQGASEEEAFFVRCDHTTMTQDDIDNGLLIVELGIAPVKPAEFVVFRIQQKRPDAEA